MMRGDLCSADRDGRMEAGKACDPTGYELTPLRAGQADLGVRILWGPDSVSTRTLPLNHSRIRSPSKSSFLSVNFPDAAARKFTLFPSRARGGLLQKTPPGLAPARTSYRKRGRGGTWHPNCNPPPRIPGLGPRRHNRPPPNPPPAHPALPNDEPQLFPSHLGDFYRSRIMIRLAVRKISLLPAAVACLLPASAFAGVIQWVTVGDPGNTADTAPSGYGAVATSFQIMKYEFTNQQYADFLNSVDRNGTNPYSVYDAQMGSGGRGGITFTSSAASGSKYAVKTNMGDKPVNFVSWFDAARVSNWYHNGATSSSSTETGAYTLVGGQTTGTAPALNNGAKFYIPLEDQWYKAAYYKGGGTNAGYWNYATQSDAAPTAVTAPTVGIGTSGSVSPVTSGNFANYDQIADWNRQDGNVSTVGTNGGASAYGAFDMSGNLGEWYDLTGAAGTTRGTRGGHWSSDGPLGLSSAQSLLRDPSYGGNEVGFRLASPVSGPSSVPEIAPSSIGSVLALVLGSLARLERRRPRRSKAAEGDSAVSA